MSNRSTPGRIIRILVTGAAGFVGKALIDALLKDDLSIEIIAADIGFGQGSTDPRVVQVECRLDRPGAIDALVETPFDCVFHLATVAGVGSTDFDLGKRTNLDATMHLLERLRAFGGRPRFVYASSVGVFGAPLPESVTDDTLALPTSTYGTHKLICEYLVSDYTRAGFIDGLALRFPGIIARPEGSTTMLSAFLNDIFYAARAGRDFSVPLRPNDGSWVMSLKTLIKNLLLARRLNEAAIPRRRFWNLPASYITMERLVAELARVYGQDAIARFSYLPGDKVRAMFAQVPLEAAGAECMGFRGDGSVEAFVRNVIADVPVLRPEDTR